jgi:hypothetical protein
VLMEVDENRTAQHSDRIIYLFAAGLEGRKGCINERDMPHASFMLSTLEYYTHLSHASFFRVPLSRRQNSKSQTLGPHHNPFATRPTGSVKVCINERDVSHAGVMPNTLLYCSHQSLAHYSQASIQSRRKHIWSQYCMHAFHSRPCEQDF